ncbi:rhomboid family intramembrane serine protease [Rhodococcus aerolatus]
MTGAWGQTSPGQVSEVCFRHPDRPTGLRCTRCGRPACPECLREASVGFHCVACVAEGRAQSRTAVNALGTPLQQGSADPRATYGLIGANVLVFVLSVLAAGGNVTANYASQVFGRLSLAPILVAEGSWWQVVTSGFLHYGPLHLAVNMLALWVLGRDLEAALGWARYLGVYAVSLLGGSASVMLFENPLAATVGASGAVFGLMGAIAVVLLKLRRSPRPVLTIIGLNVVISFVVPGISLFAHLGGLVTGALAAAAIVYAPRARRSAVQWAGVAGVGVLALVLIGVAVLRLKAEYGV